MAQHGHDHSRPHRTAGNVPPVRRRVDDSCCRMDLAVVRSRAQLLLQLLPENGRIETERFADVLEAERPRAIRARQVCGRQADTLDFVRTPLPRHLPMHRSPTVVDGGLQHRGHQRLVRVESRVATPNVLSRQDHGHHFDRRASASSCPARTSAQKCRRFSARLTLS